MIVVKKKLQFLRYPNRLVPHVVCRWDFRAGIDSRYILQFEFLDRDPSFYQAKEMTNSTDHYFLYSKSLFDTCVPNLEVARLNCLLNANYYKKVWNGIPENQPPRYSIIGRFCPNSTLFVSNTDIATLFYSDSTTSAMLGHYGRWPLNPAGGNETLNGTTDGGQVMLYKPFHVKYTKVYSHGIIYSNLQKLFAIWDEWFQFRCQTSTITCLAHSMSLNQCMWRSKNSSQK